MSDEMRKLANEEMEFPDEEVELSKEELVEEAKSIMEEVNGDQKVVDRPLPVNLRKNIDKRILALKAKEEKAEGERFSAEERELMRLGKLYKKKRKMRKYFVLAAAVVCALAFGVTSMGGPERVFESFKILTMGREQVQINSDDKVEVVESVSEEEAYQQIEDEFGFYPVKPLYKSEGVNILEINMEDEIQGAYLIYGEQDEVKITYLIRPNYRTSSLGKDIEDELLEEYVEENEHAQIYIRKYLRDNKEERWSIQFEYQNVSYSMMIYDTSQDEVEKIVKNLFFS